VKVSKCSFAQRQIDYLGHVISEHGVSTNPRKIIAVAKWPSPTTIKDLISFLGLAGTIGSLLKTLGSFASL
jgi:hypothetical protein